MIKKLLILFSLLIPVILIANPKPFGLEIGKTTIQDLKNKFHIKYGGIDEYTKDKFFYISPKDLHFDGIEDAIAMFSKNKKLVALLLKLPDSKFDYIFNILNSKYKLIKKTIPEIGDKYAEFIDGNVKIIISAPFPGFDMYLDYIDKNYLKKYNLIRQKKKKEKRKKESDEL